MENEYKSGDWVIPNNSWNNGKAILLETKLKDGFESNFKSGGVKQHISNCYIIRKAINEEIPIEFRKDINLIEQMVLV